MRGFKVLHLAVQSCLKIVATKSLNLD